MGDLSSIEATEGVGLVGLDSQGVEQTPVGSTPNGDLKTADVPNTSAVYGTLSVNDTTPVELKVGGTALAGRKMVSIQPIDGRLYYGYNNSVTSATGTELARKQIILFSAGPQITIFLLAETGTVDVRIGELA